MALIDDPTRFLPVALAVVALLAGMMTWLSVRSYQATGNVRLLFVTIAFVAFVLKSSFLFLNDVSAEHPLDHHMALMVSSIFDVLILLMLFVPFFTRQR